MYRFFYPCMLALATIFAGTPLSVTAQHNNFSITPAPGWLAPYAPDLQKTPDLREISSGYYLRLLEEQYHAEHNSQYRHVIRQIISEAGVQNAAEVSVDYDPAYEKLKFHQLLVRRNGKIINKLDAGKFKFLQQEKELSRFIYSGLYTAYFIIDDVRKGDQIEYSYTLEGKNPIFEDRYFNTFYLGADEPIANFYKCLQASPSRNIRFRSFNKAPLPVKRVFNGITLYEWDSLQIITPRNTSYNTPSWYNAYAKVQASEYTTWEEVVNWALKVNAVQHITPALQARIASWQKESGSNKTLYMQKAVRFVQDEIRYMGIEMGEYSHRPSMPDKVLARRFGDCKDKSLLLCSLLQANGIDASLAYANTYFKGRLTDYLPSPVLFNHAIVYATVDGKSYWIDPTINYQRGPVSNIAIPDYQKALVIRKGNTDLSDIIPAASGKTNITESFTLPADNEKPAQLKVISNYSAGFADNIRSFFAETSMKDLERSYLDYYKSIYGNVTADTTVQVVDSDNPNLFEVTESYALQAPWKADSTVKGRQLFYVQAKILTDLLPVIATDTPDAPLALKYPYSLDYVITLHMPEDWSLEDEALHIKNRYYRIDFTASVYGRTVKMHYQYESYQDHVPVTALATYREDRRKLGEVAAYTYFWTPGAGAASGKTGNTVSWLMLTLAMLFVGIFSYIGVKFYKRSVLPVRQDIDPWPIGGWLVLMGIGIIISPLTLLISTIENGLLSNSTWEAVIHADDSQVRLLVMIAELAANAFLWVYSILLLVLFIKRRDTFPAANIVAYAAALTLNVLDHVAVGALNNSFDWRPDEITTITRSIIAAAIWIPYLLKSERVKHTFVVPHSSALPPNEYQRET
ncbi:DUF3857 domain-containing protein [Chitinophaga japonensis]|uniref:Uncharacterized protein DUF3857 n=1 Tax=Chitinophaga japonensis TaxID=104662 RepID=A0A562TEW3_CHIJA|nr:DUF3857 domain-containing protein [Chitinophaga japonensis]TWI91804.1 uncharacterized protein DUF3857 [Chitinophaga japonensis]